VASYNLAHPVEVKSHESVRKCTDTMFSVHLKV